MSELTGQYLAASTRPRQSNESSQSSQIRQSHPTVLDKPLLRIEGAPICAVIVRDGITYLQFKDKWKERVHARGGNEYIEISLSDFEKLAMELVHVESI